MLVLLAVGLMLVAPARQRVVTKVADLRSGDWNDLLTGRLDGWQAAWWMFEQSPWNGIGHGAFRAEFGTAKRQLVGEGVDFYRRHSQPYFVNAHSEPLEVLAEWGLLGSLLAAAALVILVRNLSSPAVPAPLQGVARAGALALGLLALANFPLRLALVAYPALLLFAGALCHPPGRSANEVGSST